MGYRLDSGLLEEMMNRAKLSIREKEAMRLDCSEPLTDEEIAGRMGCAVASVRTYRQRGRKKLQTAQEAFVAELLGRESEDLDEEDLDRHLGVEKFLLEALIPPRHKDHGPQISLTYVQYDFALKREFILAGEAALHAGAMVTPRDVAYGRRFRPIEPNPYGRDT